MYGSGTTRQRSGNPYARAARKLQPVLSRHRARVRAHGIRQAGDRELALAACAIRRSIARRMSASRRSANRSMSSSSLNFVPVKLTFFSWARKCERATVHGTRQDVGSERNSARAMRARCQCGGRPEDRTVSMLARRCAAHELTRCFQLSSRKCARPSPLRRRTAGYRDSRITPCTPRMHIEAWAGACGVPHTNERVRGHRRRAATLAPTSSSSKLDGIAFASPGAIAGYGIHS